MPELSHSRIGELEAKVVAPDFQSACSSMTFFNEPAKLDAALYWIRPFWLTAFRQKYCAADNQENRHNADKTCLG